MKKSPLASGMADKIVRICRLILSASLLLGATAAAAQVGGAMGQIQNNGNNLVGQWHGVYQGITFTIVIQPNGQYSQLAQKGTLMTQQSGPYKLAAPNTIVFSVTNWQPKTQQIYHATGTVGGYYTTERTDKPHGATDSFVFKGANTVVFTDQVMHGSITLTRVQ